MWPDSALLFSYALTNLMFRTSQCGRHGNYSHFTDEKTEHREVQWIVQSTHC